MFDAGRHNLRAKKLHGRERELAYHRKCELIRRAISADPNGQVIIVSDIQHIEGALLVMIGFSLRDEPWFGVHMPFKANDDSLQVVLRRPRRGAA